MKNQTNTELYINNKKYKYEKYFIPEKEGEYNILLKFNIIISDCSCMFGECSNIINIDLILKMLLMFGMFYGCSNLTNNNLTSFSTKNVINMNNMFGGCSNLTNIDLSSFNTKKVTDMAGILMDVLNYQILI